MKPRSTNIKIRNTHKERGTFLVAVAAAFFAILIIVGWAIDASNLYHAKLSVQRAVDAGVMAGATALSNGVSSAPAYQVALEVARANLDEAGFPQDVPNNAWVIPKATPPPPDTIALDGGTNVPLVFLRMVPWMSDNQAVSASAAAQIGSSTSAAIVSIVLDTTGSMDCPSAGPCTHKCANAPPHDCPDGGLSKIAKLKEAAILFIRQFDVGRDQISLINFDDAPHLIKRMDTSFGGNINDIINNKIPALRASGRTNIEGAIIKGQEQLALARPVPNGTTAKKFLVLITDGAPNRSSAYGSSDVVHDPQNPCLNGGDAASDEDKQHYLRAIKAADDARSHESATFYSVGLGELFPGLVSTTAYEGLGQPEINPNDVAQYIKPMLLRRLSNAFKDQDPNNPDLYFDCVKNFADYNTPPSPSDSPPAEGRYYTSETGDQLAAILRTIGNLILSKPRIVQ